MEYSDPSLLDFLCGIARDVLVQSCDKYYEHNLEAYLQVFLSFVQCIRRWFPIQERDDNIADNNEEMELDLMNDLLEYIKNTEEAERLMETEEFEQETGRSVEEMYKEDLKSREDNVLDYDDKVTEEKRPLPEHVSVTSCILKRCVMFVVGQRRAAAALALATLAAGLPVLESYHDELLPLVHQAWGPLAHRCVRTAFVEFLQWILTSILNINTAIIRAYAKIRVRKTPIFIINIKIAFFVMLYFIFKISKFLVSKIGHFDPMLPASHRVGKFSSRLDTQFNNKYYKYQFILYLNVYTFIFINEPWLKSNGRPY
ncbi:unnamed protein product [Diatraea saccharalis]|uniref:TTI1 C-terminal TPR domain-containing protein n=1 Tax=Diatraea saccharalis TaxID=40085 RepID=A0A9P0BZQ9_9NEOP|nr:unnamed protein product [Diatraea saccharalis]